MDATIDFFWSFRSPYSYVAMPGALQLERDYRVNIRFRPVLPLAVSGPSFFSPDNLKRARYIGLGWPRRAEMLGIAQAWPSPDPIVQTPQTHRIAEDEQLLRRS